jgi:CBS domain-containing protein
MTLGQIDNSGETSSAEDGSVIIFELTTLLGRAVRSANGGRIGRVVDLTATISTGHPRLDLVAVGRHGHVALLVRVSDLEDISTAELRVRSDAEAVAAEDGWAHDSLRLNRDVLDCQVIDLAGKRVARVCEVLLTRTRADHYVVGVEVGAAGVLRRLGFGRLAQRIPREVVDWEDLRLTAQRARALQFVDATSGVQRLEPAELATVLAHVPVEHAIEILHASHPAAAADALAAAHSSLGTRLLHALPRHSAAAFVGHMAADDAVTLLRDLPVADLDAVLAGVETDRAATLRKLIQHEPGTAGGLMNTEVATADAGEPSEAIRARLLTHVPDVEAHGVVFVLDDQHRPVGTFEPQGLLIGQATPTPVPTIDVGLPVERVIDLFALNDYLAMPVVDSTGRFVGAITADDVLEELWAERLPGRGRFAGVRRGRLRPKRAARRAGTP